MMNQEQQEAALEVARMVRAGAKTLTEASHQLHREQGINLRSAALVIGVYLRLCQGRAFTFRASRADLEFFMNSFARRAELHDFVAALESLRLHIQHREERGYPVGFNRTVLADSEALYKSMADVPAASGMMGNGDAPPDLERIAQDLNARAKDYRIGKLHQLRKRLKGGQRTARADGSIFARGTIDREGNWAFHYGGRSELQFNIGVEHFEGTRCLRFGVAFSLEPSQTLPDIALLYPKVKRFNEYMTLYPMAFPGFLQWCWAEERSPLYRDAQIRAEFVGPRRFVFFGKYIPWAEYSPECILSTFDQLLPLYEYVEGPEGTEALELQGADRFVFEPNDFDPTESTQYSRAQRVIDVNLRHMVIQRALFVRLREKHGVAHVCCERSSGVGIRVDVMVRSGEEYWFYEVKTGGTARACIREALGQLLEYAYWPGAQRATRLVVVGEPSLDARAREYLAMLRQQFSLPIEYEQQVIDR
jgi:hypothetical protein